MEADALATAAHDKNQQAIQRLQQRIHILDEAQQRYSTVQYTNVRLQCCSAACDVAPLCGIALLHCPH